MERDPWNPTPAELARRRKRRSALRDELGLPLPDWDDDRNAPPVEPGAIQAVLAGTAVPGESQRVSWLIFRYHVWARAYVRAAMARDGRGPNAD